MGVEVGTFSGASIVGPTTAQTEPQGARVGTLSGAAIFGPTAAQTEPQGIRLGTLTAVVIIGPQTGPEGTDRPDLLARVAFLPISSITQTGTVLQGDRPVDREDSRLTVGEQTEVTQITVTWSSGPTTQQLTDFNRVLSSNVYEVTHE